MPFQVGNKLSKGRPKGAINRSTEMAKLTLARIADEGLDNLKKDLQDLDKRFTKKKRDIGKLAIERSKAIERIINSASDKAARCIEIASGSPLTEQEINATLKSQINTECPSIANPNYVPHNE